MSDGNLVDDHDPKIGQTRVVLGGVVFRRRCRRFHIVAFSQSEPSLSFSAVVPSRYVCILCVSCQSWSCPVVLVHCQASPLSSVFSTVRRRVEMEEY